MSKMVRDSAIVTMVDYSLFFCRITWSPMLDGHFSCS